MEQVKRYGFIDFRDGEYGVQYSFPLLHDAQAAAAKVGISRFQGYGDDFVTPIAQFCRSHDGTWRQEQNSVSR